MITIILNDEYEKALVVLALRQFSTAQFQNAIKSYESNDSITGAESTERGENASIIANRIQ